jgi:hypothetical protein
MCRTLRLRESLTVSVGEKNRTDRQIDSYRRSSGSWPSLRRVQCDGQRGRNDSAIQDARHVSSLSGLVDTDTDATALQHSVQRCTLYLSPSRQVGASRNHKLYISDITHWDQ